MLDVAVGGNVECGGCAASWLSASISMEIGRLCHAACCMLFEVFWWHGEVAPACTWLGGSSWRGRFGDIGVSMSRSSPSQRGRRQTAEGSGARSRLRVGLQLQDPINFLRSTVLVLGPANTAKYICILCIWLEASTFQMDSRPATQDALQIQPTTYVFGLWPNTNTVMNNKY